MNKIRRHSLRDRDDCVLCEQEVENLGSFAHRLCLWSRDLVLDLAVFGPTEVDVARGKTFSVWWLEARKWVPKA